MEVSAEAWAVPTAPAGAEKKVNGDLLLWLKKRKRSGNILLTDCQLVNVLTHLLSQIINIKRLGNKVICEARFGLIIV